MCWRAGCCATNDLDYCCLPPRHSCRTLGAQFPSRAAICHPCPCATTLPPSPSPLVIQWKTHCALMTDAWHLPLSPSHLSPCSPAVWLPLLSDFFNTPLRLLAHQLLRHTLPPSPFPIICKWRTKDVSFTTKVEMHLHQCPPSPTCSRHGVNTNEEEMSPLLCPHLSQWPRDLQTHP